MRSRKIEVSSMRRTIDGCTKRNEASLEADVDGVTEGQHS